MTYAVRSTVINDATIEDARASGLEECTRLISTDAMRLAPYLTNAVMSS